MKLFTEHPQSVGESYFEHMGVAASFGGHLFVASMACFAHAVFPFLFTKTGSGIITKLHDRMVTSRARQTKGSTATDETSKAHG